MDCRSAILIPIFFAAAAHGAEPAPPPRQKIAYYYPVTVGAKWVYQTKLFDKTDEDRTLVVTALEGKGVEKIVTVGRIGRDDKVTPWEEVRVGDQSVYRLEDQGRWIASLCVSSITRIVLAIKYSCWPISRLGSPCV